MTEKNGFNGPDDRSEDETQILENPIIVSRVRQDLQKVLEGPDGGFRSRRASIMQQIRAEAAQNKATPPTTAPIPVVSPNDDTQRFTLPINRPEPQTDTEATQRFTLPPTDATQRFEMPSAPEEATQRFNVVPSVTPSNATPVPSPAPAPSQPDNATTRFDLSQAQAPAPARQDNSTQPVDLSQTNDEPGDAATQQFKLPQAQDFSAKTPPPAADSRFTQPQMRIDPRFTQPQQQAPQVDPRFTRPQSFEGPAQEPAQGFPTQAYNQPAQPVEPERRFPEASPPIRGIIGQNPVIPPPTPISVRPRKTGQRFSGWMGAIAAALVLLVVAGAVFIYIANSNNPKTNTEALNSSQGTQAAFSATAPAALGTKAAATTAAATTAAAPVAASAAQTTAASSSDSAAASAVQTTAAGATTAAATTAAATTAAATTAAATTAAATTAASATTAAAATTAASGGAPNFASVTPVPAVSTGPGQSARATGLPQYPNSTQIANLGTGGPIKFYLKNDAAAAVPNAADRQARGLDDTTVGRYNFTGYKTSGLVADDVVKFYQDQAVSAGYKVESTTELVKDNGSGNKMVWIYLSKGTDHVGILVVDSADAETGSSFGLDANETGIYFSTT